MGDTCNIQQEFVTFKSARQLATAGYLAVATDS